MNSNGENYIHECLGGPLAVTNHDPVDLDYDDEENSEVIDDTYYYDDTGARLRQITREAKKWKAKSLEGCLGVLRKSPVWKSNTQQSMVMCAKTGEVLLQ